MSQTGHHRHVNKEAFCQAIREVTPPEDTTSVDELVEWFGDSIEQAAQQSSQDSQHGADYQWDPQQHRWQRILDSGDQRLIWESIGWDGTLKSDNDNEEPSEEDFKSHFEALLFDSEEPELEDSCDQSPYIPCLDDPITPQEVERAIKETKLKGYIGTSPGLLKWLPVRIVCLIAHILTLIFFSAAYPTKWCYTRLQTIFKGGCRQMCGNFRGIAIMDSLAKLYDCILNQRLVLWSVIDKAQAGAQKGRSCIEQILCLRLLIDFCMFRRQKLYIVFVDFKKAYDRVGRKKLIECLKKRGCGRMMLLALQVAYRCTKMLLQNTKIATNVGVRQGAPTSSLLFVMYIDEFVKKLKNCIPDDGFLGKLHTLLLMDDTVILATSREMCEEKLKILLEYCTESNMQLNERKTKFMTINGKEADKQPIEVAGVR